MGKLRIKDLSVGDWVKYEFPVGKMRVQVYSIDAEDNHIGTEGVGGSAWSNISNFEPIPLTPKILEKNGFELADEWDGCLMYGSPEGSIVHTKGTMHYRLETPQASVVCYFVHQLQHAFRLAGIEKDIEL